MGPFAVGFFAPRMLSTLAVVFSDALNIRGAVSTNIILRAVLAFIQATISHARVLVERRERTFPAALKARLFHAYHPIG